MGKFLVDKAPYIVTILFGSLGWGLTHATDRVLNSPMIEYAIEPGSEASERNIRVTLENISHTEAFRSLEFALLAPSGATFKDGSAITVPTQPAWEGEIAARAETRSAIFPVSQLHPGWRLELRAALIGPGTPRLVLRQSGPSQAIRLVPASLETWIARNELVLTLVMVGLWMILIVVILGIGQRIEAGRGGAEAED